MDLYLNGLKEAFKFIVAYIKTNMGTKIKEASLKALVAFKDALWKELKNTVHEQAFLAIRAAEVYYSAEQVKVKKKELVSQVVDSIKFPVVLKPFKGLMKSYLTKRVDNLIQGAIQKGYTFLAE